jgi:gamma-glutamyltranspeptidase / glutathione hydrolase
MKHSGVVACGHGETARAAELMLREGGNAFDAVIAAFLSACVAEPVLASLGGGGFLLAHTRDRGAVIYDFFAQTPQKPLPEDRLDFYPIHADFGTTTQEFHIGLASIATPGAIKGIFKIHRDLGSMPMRDLAAPAIEAARNGVVMSAFQAYILDIVSPILNATDESRNQFLSHVDANSLIGEGELLRQPQLADFLEALAYEGEDLFYRGEVAHSISRLCADGGGQLTQQDLADYRVVLC